MVLPLPSSLLTYCVNITIHAVGTHYTNQTLNLDPPECSIKTTNVDGQSALMCSAIANPEDVTFVWKILEDNYTEDARPAFETGLDSYLVLDHSFHMLRTYICYTNNSVGESTPCEIQVPGEYL